MEITGSHEIPLDRETVWAALNDPEVLKACIPGCQEFTPTEDGYEAKVIAKVGPVKATFTGSVTLEDVNPPESYVIVGGGKGGQAGFARGKAKVILEEAGVGVTRLTYAADAQVGGKLAQVGSRLIQSTAHKYAADFFSCFAERLAPPAAEVETREVEVPAGAVQPPMTSRRRWMIGGLLVVAALILVLLLAG